MTRLLLALKQSMVLVVAYVSWSLMDESDLPLAKEHGASLLWTRYCPAILAQFRRKNVPSNWEVSAFLCLENYNLLIQVHHIEERRQVR